MQSRKIIHGLLSEGRVQRDAPQLRQSPETSRLKWLCEEMAMRVLDEADDTEFGDIDGMVGEAAALAKSIGFPNPPVESIAYDRGADYNVPNVSIAAADGMAFGWGGRLMWPSWAVYWHRHPNILYVFGYRFHDPDPATMPYEAHVTALAEQNGPATGDPWERKSKTRQRTEAVKHLRRWVRLINAAGSFQAEEDARPEVRLSDTEESQAEPVGRPAKRVKEPCEKALQAYRISTLVGGNQTEVAEMMVRHGCGKPCQGQVSKWLKQVNAWLKAGNAMPALPGVQSVDPTVLDMGAREDGRTERQRPRRSQD